jgi:hypothetical protein
MAELNHLDPETDRITGKVRGLKFKALLNLVLSVHLIGMLGPPIPSLIFGTRRHGSGLKQRRSTLPLRSRMPSWW